MDNTLIQMDLCALTEAHLKKDEGLFLEAKMQLYPNTNPNFLGAFS